MTTDMTAYDGPPPGDEDNEFESFGHDNGHRYWWRSDLMRLLGYQSLPSFQKAVGKAMSACVTLGIPVRENFEYVETVREAKLVDDCKMSRFACYLTAMNADPRKPEVARAQGYFASLAEATHQLLLHTTENMERVLIRDELSDREKALVGAAHGAGVRDYALFQNQGYRGLYNMNLRQLKQLKGVNNGKTLLDFMGKEELAANLFRITQTEAKIKKDNVRGQAHLEQTAFGVGKQVRDTIKKIGGTMPEQLPPAEDIAKVKSGLKKTHRQLQKLDRKQLPSKSKEE